MKASRIRVGVIGLGEHMQQNLLPGLQSLGGVDVVAVCCRHEEKARAFARRHGIERASGSWREVLHDTTIDAVVIAGPPSLHYEVLMHALNLGLHAFVEKPPAEGVPQLRELVEREAKAGSTGCKVFVDYNFRFGPAYQMMREVLAAYGEVAFAQVRFITSKPRVPAWNFGSVLRSYLYAIAVHPVEMAVDLFGDPSGVTAGIKMLSGGCLALHIGVDFVAGGRAELDLGNYGNKFDFSCELVTRGAAVGMVSDQRMIRLFGDGIGDVGHEVFRGRANVEYWYPSSRAVYDAAGYQSALRSFCHSIEHDERSESPLAQSVPVFEVLERVARQVDGGGE